MFRIISFSFTEDVIKRDCEAAELALKQGNLPVCVLVPLSKSIDFVIYYTIRRCMCVLVIVDTLSMFKVFHPINP